MSPVKRYSGDVTRDVAPGPLESVRALLNTGGARDPADRLAGLVADPEAWRAEVGGRCRPTAQELTELRDLRADLRRELGRTHPDGLQDWVDRLDVRPVLSPDGTPWPVVLAPARTSCVGELLCAALDAVNRGLWHRLRACPDCRYVFFDSSRNGSRTWCRMTRDDPSGRSCGTLAKARAKRARDRAARSPSA